MKTENYINIIQNFNKLLEEKCNGFCNQALYFEYTTQGYINYIMLSSIVLFDSDNDTNIESEYELESLLKKRLFELQKCLGLLI